jgi:hypothetical protein
MHSVAHPNRCKPGIPFPLVQERTQLAETSGSVFADQCKELYASQRYAELVEAMAAQLNVVLDKVQNDQGRQ